MPPELRRVDKTVPELGGQVQVRDLLLSERLAFRRIIAALERDAVTAGVQAGDLLLAINTEVVTTPEQVRVCAGRPGRSMALLVLRDGARIFVPLRLG